MVPAAPRVDPSVFIQQLRRRMDKLRPTPTARHSSPATFMHRDLKDSTHGRTPYTAPLTHHTSARTKSLPAPTKHLKLSSSPGRSLHQQTESILHTYRKRPRSTPRLTPAAHQPNHAALQPQQPHHRSRFRGLHDPVAPYTSRLTSLRKPSSPQRGDVGTATWPVAAFRRSSSPTLPCPIFCFLH